jgi:acetate kinase
VRTRLQALVDLAPLHQPAGLAALDAVRDVQPGLPAVACFDTAFHATMPAEAFTYALPEDLRRRWGLRRYGFHGLSHAYAARRAAALLGPEAPHPLRVVTCHLGAGASLAAVSDGRCVDTTMGFTPNEGLVMATRSGSVDPGLLLWLQTHAGMTAAEVTDVVEHRSGLLGLAGSADMAEVVRRAGRGDIRASTAVAVYVHRLRGAVAAMAASLGGIDALVFTGGVGERAAVIRSLVGDGLALIGVAVDGAANATARPDCEIGPPGASVRVLVVQAREDVEIARGVRAVLDALA